MSEQREEVREKYAKAAVAAQGGTCGCGPVSCCEEE